METVELILFSPPKNVLTNFFIVVNIFSHIPISSSIDGKERKYNCITIVHDGLICTI